MTEVRGNKKLTIFIQMTEKKFHSTVGLLRIVTLWMIAILFTHSATAKVYYASTTGSDYAPGSFDRPFATWEMLASVLSPGDTGYIRGGIYRTTKSPESTSFCLIEGKNGTPANSIYIMAYRNEQPVFNLDNIYSTGKPTVYIMWIKNCSWIHIKGLRATGLAQNADGSNYTYGWFIDGGNNITIENCESDKNCEGFSAANTSDLLFLNCDAHHLQDPYSPDAYGGSNGFSSTQQPASTTITFKGCRAWRCSDDGFDFFDSDGTYNLDSCWAFWNGYKPGTYITAGNGVGFKLGPTHSDLSGSSRHFLKNCVAAQNRTQGFDQNDAKCINQLYNCTSYMNEGIGYHFNYNPSLNIRHILKNNISFQDKRATALNDASIQTNNTWNEQTTIKVSSFISLENTGINGPRQANGSLPLIQFLHPAPGSGLNGKGAF